MQLAPVIAANETLPAELVLAAHRLTNQAGDLLFAASSLCVQADRIDIALDKLDRTIAEASNCVRACHATTLEIERRLAALTDGAAS